MSASGRFVWFDLMTNDPAAARAFYSELFGWSTQDYPMGGDTYQMFAANGTSFGGIQGLMGAQLPDHWVAYISTPNVDTTCATVRELGGNVCVPPTDIPNVGRFAVVNDPQGALFSPFTGAQGSQAPDMPQPPPVGRFCWHELLTTDPQAAFAFYSRVFGYTEGQTMDMGEEGGKYLMFKSGDDTVGGIAKMPKDVPSGVPPHWLHYVHVENVDATVDRARSLGGHPVFGPMDIPGGHGRIAAIVDPRGAAIALWTGAAKS